MPTTVRRTKAILLSCCLLVAVSGCARPVAAPNAPIQSSDALDSTSLQEPISYDRGMILFEPPPAGITPGVTAEDAYASYNRTSLYPNASKYSAPYIRFGLYTNNGEGTPAPGGGIKLENVRKPVWIIIFRDVPDYPAGGAHVSGESAASSQPQLHEIVCIVDASSAVALDVLSDLPDVPTQPRPPSVNPDGKPSVPPSAIPNS